MSDKKNSRDYNSGDYNSGDYNTGYYNTGYYNTGYYNSGDYNTGYYNSRDYNSGYYNSGDYNSGDCNSGHYNSGDYNSGDYNSGNYNSGNSNSGFFNTDEPTVRMFNRDTGKLRKEINIPYIHLKTTEWVPENKMTEEQKQNAAHYCTTKGVLIKRTYKEAWSLFWKETTKEIKQQFLSLPNFNPKIFEEITGISLEKREETSSCSGKIVEIDGKKYELKEIL